MKDSVMVSKPKTCGDCICFHSDSDYGSWCGYNDETTDSTLYVENENFKHQDCLFRDVSYI